MKQFTSNLDLPLTRKRLQMMGASFSRLRSNAKVALIIPLFLALTMIFCTEAVIERKADAIVNGVPVYSLTKLDHNVEHPWYGVMGARMVSTKDGVPFTGIKQTFHNETDELVSERVYEEGYLMEITNYNRDYSSQVQRTSYIYEGNRPVEVRSYDWNGDHLNTRKIVMKYDQYVGDRVYNANQQLILEILYINASDDPNGLGSTKSWHENGQLKLSYQHDWHGKQGLMTSYDEQGNILEQERYKNGELVEKIK